MIEQVQSGYYVLNRQKGDRGSKETCWKAVIQVGKVLDQDVNKKGKDEAHRIRYGVRKRGMKDIQDFWSEQLEDGKTVY